jgi:hypothetical protein
MTEEQVKPGDIVNWSDGESVAQAVVTKSDGDGLVDLLVLTPRANYPLPRLSVPRREVPWGPRENPAATGRWSPLTAEQRERQDQLRQMAQRLAKVG